MKPHVSVPVMIQDPSFRAKSRVTEERLDPSMFACFLKGPVTDRVAVLDFDPESGSLASGTEFAPAESGTTGGKYRLADPQEEFSPNLCQCNAFGVVADTMAMFEEADVLGRRLSWGFDAPQLLVIPRAGEWANAFYHRDSHSLQFFFFRSRRAPDRKVYTSLSRDIVAHETGHAVLDGICPELYNAVTPQSLALHEAVADLTALVSAFRCDELAARVLERTNGSIERSSEFSALAEEFGAERGLAGPAYLRNLDNDLVLDPSISHADPHHLCEVLTGAIYKVTLKIYERLKKQTVRQFGGENLGAFKKALYLTHERLSRMVFRALDYLPPGEISFADYGRAVLAADQASHPQWSPERKWLVQEFVRRKIVDDPSELAIETNWTVDTKTQFTLEELVASDWAAYTFVRKHRKLLGIPPGVPFEVHPRLDVTKAYYTGGGKRVTIRECLLKVSWQHTEPNRVGSGYPARRRFTVGTTLAIDWEKTAKGNRQLAVRAVLTTKPTRQSAQDRDRMISRMIDRGWVQREEEIETLDGKRPGWAVAADCAQGYLRLRGTLKVLHLLGER